MTVSDIEFYESVFSQSTDLKKGIQAERMKTYRLRKKVRTLKEMMEDLKEQSLVSSDFVDNLLGLERKDILSIIENELRNCNANPGAMRYGEDIKKFCLTVYFHSPAAYRYLRTHLTLPHERTLIRWMSKVNDSPGFTSASLEIIKTRIDNGEIEAECVLIIDSMSIRKEAVYCHHEGRNIGYVDLGTGVGSPKKAGEALVFLVNGLRTKWRYPVGYFLVGRF